MRVFKVILSQLCTYSLPTSYKCTFKLLEHNHIPFLFRVKPSHEKVANGELYLTGANGASAEPKGRYVRVPSDQRAPYINQHICINNFWILNCHFFKFKISNSMTRHGFGQAKITEKTSRGRNETKTIIRTINKEIIWRADGLPWSFRVNSIVSPELAALVRGRRRHGAGRAALWLRDDWVLKVDLKISIYVWSYRNRGEIIFSVIRPLKDLQDCLRFK